MAVRDPEKEKVRAKAYRDAHKEEIADRRAKRREALMAENPEKERARQRDWYKDNKRAKHEYYLAHKTAWRESYLRRKAKKEAICALIMDEIDDISSGFSATEGGQHLAQHLVRERNTTLVRRKKAEAKKTNTLFCEVCGFSFCTTYRVEYIECHHIIPISTPDRKKSTSLNDLALVCSDCHKMLHVQRGGLFATIDQLKARITACADGALPPAIVNLIPPYSSPRARRRAFLNPEVSQKDRKAGLPTRVDSSCSEHAEQRAE